MDVAVAPPHGPLVRKSPATPNAYVNVCIIDLDVGGKVTPHCDITVAQSTTTTPIPTVSEESVVVDLPPRDCVLSFRFWDAPSGRELGSFHASSRQLPQAGQVIEKWVPIHAHGVEVNLANVPVAARGSRARILLKYVGAETARQESLVEKTFAAQDFLILALQSLNKELDEDRVPKRKEPPTRAPAPKAKQKPVREPSVTSVQAAAEAKSVRLTASEQRLLQAQKAQQRRKEELDDLAFQKSEPYRNLIMVLEEKLKASRDAEDALRLAKEHWDQSEAARKELQLKLQAANEDFSNQIKQTLSLHSNLNVEKEKVQQRCEDLQTELTSTKERLGEMERRAMQAEHEAQDVNARLVAAKHLEVELRDTKARLAAECEAREELESKVQEMADSFEARSEADQQAHASLVTERQELAARLLDAHETLKRQRDLTQDAASGREQQLVRIVQLEQQVVQLDGVRQQLADAKALASRLESQLEVRSDQFDEFKKSFEAQLARESEVQQRLLREKASTQERCRQLERDVTEKVEATRGHTRAMAALQAQVAELEERVRLASDLESVTAKGAATVQAQAELRESLTEQLSLQGSRFELELAEVTQAREREQAESARLREEVSSLNKELESARLSYQQLSGEDLPQAKLEVLTLRQRFDDRDALERELANARQECSDHKDQREEVTRALKALTERYEQQLREWEDARADREDELEMRNFEISRLQSRIMELTTEYKPVKGDQVDQLLAHLVNTFHPPVPFMRLSSGVYLFGSRKVIAKVNGVDKLVFRVGGGYHTFEEFLDLYRDEEQDKLRNYDSGLHTEVSGVSRLSQSPSVRSHPSVQDGRGRVRSAASSVH
jgi:hypothetical protein